MESFSLVSSTGNFIVFEAAYMYLCSHVYTCKHIHVQIMYTCTSSEISMFRDLSLVYEFCVNHFFLFSWSMCFGKKLIFSMRIVNP